MVALLHLLVRTELVVMEQIQLHQSAHLHRNHHQMNPNSILEIEDMLSMHAQWSYLFAVSIRLSL